jgi:AcrR family transcriptional regulator
MMAAALDAIYEDGYYRASANSIARRAGLTWGAIQHYFGTREFLLLAVLDKAMDEAIEAFVASTLQGETVQERLASAVDIIYGFYGRRTYLAVVQILWNLSRDPGTKLETRRHLRRFGERHNALLNGLIQQIPPDGRPVSKDATDLIITLTWGAALSDVTITYLDTPAASDDRSGLRKLLVDALAAVVV